MSSPLDLVTTEQVKAYLSAQGTPPSNTTDDANVQSCITAFSMGIILWTNRGNQDGSVPSSSPFLAPVSYTEVYDGSGSSKQYIKNSPVQSITSCQVGPTVLPLSTGWGSFGVAIGGSKDYIFLRFGSGTTEGFNTTYPWSCGTIFPKGLQNIFLTYTAGFPSGPPPDLYQMALETVALNYIRKNWIGLQSKSMAQGAGTTSYKDFEFNDYSKRTLMQYTNFALV